MKTITMILLIFATISASAQFSFEPIGIGLHGSIFNADTRNSPKNGYGLSVSFNRIYIDASSNFVAGKGQYLEFKSGYSYSTDKINAMVFNIGYILPFKSFVFIPCVGLGMTNEIYQDPISWNTYFKQSLGSKINLGIIASLKLSKNIRLQAGVGTFESLKFGLSYYTDFDFNQ